MQLRLVPATALVVLEMVPSLCVMGLEPLAQAAQQAMLTSCEGGGELARGMCCQSTMANAAKALSGSVGDSAVFT